MLGRVVVLFLLTISVALGRGGLWQTLIFSGGPAYSPTSYDWADRLARVGQRLQQEGGNSALASGAQKLVKYASDVSSGHVGTEAEIHSRAGFSAEERDAIMSTMYRLKLVPSRGSGSFNDSFQELFRQTYGSKVRTGDAGLDDREQSEGERSTRGSVARRWQTRVKSLPFDEDFVSAQKARSTINGERTSDYEYRTFGGVERASQDLQKQAMASVGTTWGTRQRGGWSQSDIMARQQQARLLREKRRTLRSAVGQYNSDLSYFNQQRRDFLENSNSFFGKIKQSFTHERTDTRGRSEWLPRRE